MAPSKTTSTKGKKSSKVSKGRQKASQQSTSRISKNKAKALPPKQQKSKAAPAKPKKKKSRIYTDEELGIPKLNMITPVGVQKFRGKKKGKVFVDDPESMMTILAMVNAEKEGQIESKMIKARQMEEIREARRKEQERKEAARKEKLEEVKDGLRKKRKKAYYPKIDVGDGDSERKGAGKPKKKVSFG